MEIKASCKYDKPAVKAFVYVTMFRKKDPKKCIAFLLCLVWFMVALALVSAVGYGTVYSFELYLVIALMFVIVHIFCFALPTLNYKAQAKLSDRVEDYLFCDDVLKTTLKTDGVASETQINYSLLAKAYETSKYLFLFPANNQGILVDKSTLSAGDMETVRDRLRAVLKDKYFVCRY